MLELHILLQKNEDMWRGADSILGSFLIVVALISLFIFCAFCATFLGSIVFSLIASVF